MDYLNSKEWLDAVGTLRAKASEFIAVFSHVERSEVFDNPELEKEKNSLIWKGNIIKNTIENLTSGIDAIFKAARNSGLSGVANFSGLGFLPLVPVAVILGAIAAITYWVNDALKYLEKVNRIKALQDEGYSTGQASEIVFGPSFSLSKNLTWIIGGAIVLIFLPPLLNQIGNNHGR